MSIKTIRRLRYWGPLLAFAGLMLNVAIKYGLPWIGGLLYGERYKELAFECDYAMHDEAALRDFDDDHEKADDIKLSADVGLMVCHEYDKLRKRLKMMGVSDDRLAMYGLEVLEIEKVPVSRMAEPHRMPRF